MKDVHQKMVEAMKAKDKAAKDAYSNILATMKAKAKDLRVDEMTAEQEIEVITKMAKQNQESIDTCPADRVEVLDKLKFEREIITQYMPKQMDEDEIKAVISYVLA